MWLSMDEFEKSEWINYESVKEFIDNSDSYILNRKRLLTILKSFYLNLIVKNLPDKPVNILDLGCGDGRVTQELLRVDKSLNCTLVDGSAEMIKNAKKRLNMYPELNFIQSTFQKMMNEHKFPVKFDFIVSSLAIHHLNMNDKKLLFKYVYNQLNPGGSFLNMDVIRAPSEFLEEWYLILWKEWILENQNEEDVSTGYIHIPDQYKDNHDNHPDKLEDQLYELKSAGFKNVDCYYQYGIFSIYGGQK
jgi:tRNA (cmo5U34)-methyltransferase